MVVQTMRSKRPGVLIESAFAVLLLGSLIFSRVRSLEIDHGFQCKIVFPHWLLIGLILASLGFLFPVAFRNSFVDKGLSSSVVK